MAFEYSSRTGEAKDQSFSHAIHKALLQNVKTGIEIRVIRGSKTTSVWALEYGELGSEGLYR